MPCDFVQKYIQAQVGTK